MPRKAIFKRDRCIEVAARKTINGSTAKRFEPGFYSDGHAVYVDMDEFLRTYGINDAPEIRAVVWAEIKDAFGEVPVYELGEEHST